MANINEIKTSRFLKKEDVDNEGLGFIVTITSSKQENIAKEGAEEEIKWCLHLQEFAKPMVLNSTNAQIIAKALASDEMDDWRGKQIVLYHDPNVSFGGELKGGIRARGLRTKNETAQPPQM
jgi:hypothetical protein